MNTNFIFHFIPIFLQIIGVFIGITAIFEEKEWEQVLIDSKNKITPEKIKFYIDKINVSLQKIFFNKKIKYSFIFIFIFLIEAYYLAPFLLNVIGNYVVVIIIISILGGFVSYLFEYLYILILILTLFSFMELTLLTIYIMKKLNFLFKIQKNRKYIKFVSPAIIILGLFLSIFF